MKWGWTIALLLFTGCASEIDRLEEPKNLIPKEKMLTILTEFTKLEAYIQSEYVQPGRYHKVMVNSGDSLLKVYGETKASFEASIEYYGSRQDEMSKMYEEVLERLNKELGEIQSVTTKE